MCRRHLPAAAAVVDGAASWSCLSRQHFAAQAQPLQAAEHSHHSQSSKPVHSRAWLAEGVRLASWAHKWVQGLMLALQGMLGTLIRMSVFLSFR